MKARFDAGTDAAMLGAWDAQRNAQPFTSSDIRRFSATLDAEAVAGHIFLLNTQADGGGPIDVYIDETIPSEFQENLEPLGGEFLLALPSGALIVDGAEYYRAPKPDRSLSNRVVTVPPGDYAARWFTPTNDEEQPRSEVDLARLVGKEELTYYDRMNSSGCIVGASTLLLFPILWYSVNWIAAAIATPVVFLSFFHIRAWVLRRNARYTDLSNTVDSFRLEHKQPTFVLELRRITDRAGLKGGSVSLN